MLYFGFTIPSSVVNPSAIERSSGFLYVLKNRYSHYCLCHHGVIIKSPGAAIYTVNLNTSLLLKLPKIYYSCNIKPHGSQRWQQLLCKHGAGELPPANVAIYGNEGKICTKNQGGESRITPCPAAVRRKCCSSETLREEFFLEHSPKGTGEAASR